MTKIVKHDLVNIVAGKSQMSRAQAGDMVELFLGEIITALTKGNKISLTGFGTFEVGMRKAREGLDPRTGERIHIPAMKTVRFKASPKLKHIVREGGVEEASELPVEAPAGFATELAS